VGEPDAAGEPVAQAWLWPTPKTTEVAIAAVASEYNRR